MSPITQKAGYHDLDSQINSCLDVKPINFEIVGNLIERISTMPNDDENDTQLLLMPSDTIVTDDTQVVPKQRIHNYELTSGNVEKHCLSLPVSIVIVRYVTMRLDQMRF